MVRVPAWVSWAGLLEHLFVGTILLLVLVLLRTPPPACVVAVLAVGIAHEIGDRDLVPGAVAWPWNGLLDVAAFVLVPVIALLVLR